MTGLAKDGGLFIPAHLPRLPQDWKHSWRDMSYQDLAVEVFSLFIDESEISRQDLRQLVDKSYSKFRHPQLTPLVRTGDREYALELFHGPTYAFKDVALQFLGNLFEYFLSRRNANKAPDAADRERITVVGATSGDTGSAAIYGLRGKKDVSIFILHPKGRVSPIQEAQMTTVTDDNVYNLAVKGTFDDCQVCHMNFGDDVLTNCCAGRRESAVRRHRVQQNVPPGRRQQHQLGSNSRTDRLLLPLILRHHKAARDR